MEIAKIIIAVIIGTGLICLVSWLTIDLIKTIKKRHDLKTGKKPKPKKEKDLDY